MGTSNSLCRPVENNRTKAELHTCRAMRSETSDADADRGHEVVLRWMLATYFGILYIWLTNSQFY